MSSKSSSGKSYTTNDHRVATDENSIGISSGGDVSVHMVADEAFEVTGLAIEELGDTSQLAISEMGDTSDRAIQAVSSHAAKTANELGDALHRSLEAQREETARILEQAVKIGIPAAALAYVAANVWSK